MIVFVKEVTTMKKIGIGICWILAAALVAAGGFLYTRGFHHGLKIWRMTDQWFSQPEMDFQIAMEAEELSLSADGFWTGSHETRVYGLDLGGAVVYCQGETLALDNGRAYALPRWEIDAAQVRQLLLGALLAGEITVQDDSYHLSVEKAGISATLIANGDSLSVLSVQAPLTWDGQTIPLSIQLQTTQIQNHTIPTPVQTALAEPASTALLEPLEPLLPAVAHLTESEMLTGTLAFSVECGVLSLDEELDLTYQKSDGILNLQRGAIHIPLNLADFNLDLPPAAIPLLLLRDGTFAVTDTEARYNLHLQPETAQALFCALIPEIGELDLTFLDCAAELLIQDKTLDTIILTGSGDVPFLITTIPISVTVEIHLA